MKRGPALGRFAGSATSEVCLPATRDVLAFVLKLADSNDAAVRTGLFCFAAGGLGALISVMSRMTSNRIRVDWEFGKDTLRTLGALRPFVGGVFGLMTFFALKSGVVALDIVNSSKSAYFYILFAFAAGFSERLAQDMLIGPTVGAAAAKGKRAAAQEPEAEEPPPPAPEDELEPATTSGTGL